MRKKKGKIKLAIFVIILILIIIIGGKVLQAGQSFFQPLGVEAQKSYLWNGSYPINLILLAEDLSLISFDPIQGTIKMVNIPKDLYLEIPGGFGSWKLGSVYALGEGEKPAKGASLLKESLTALFGLPIDGFIYSDGSGEELVKSLRQNPFQIGLKKITTDLAPWELIRFLWQIRAVRFDKIGNFNLAENLDISQLADGTSIHLADSSKIDSFIGENLLDLKLRDEQVTVAVYNGTKNPGLAGKAGRIITNLGGNVIIQTNYQRQDIEKTFTGGPESYTKTRLEKIFGLGCQDNKNCDKLNSRATMVVVLGEDFNR